MLLQFKFANFRSFADETVFNMTATPIREHKNSLIEKNGVQVLPVAAFYGANASGKSSFFMAFNAMCNLIEGVLGRDTKDYFFHEKHLDTFTLDDKYIEKPTEFEACIAINDFEYRYGFEYSKEKVLCEYLYKRKLSKNKTVEKAIFERFNGKVTCNANSALKKEIEYCASMCVDNSLLLTDLGRRNNIAEFYDIYKWFQSVLFLQRWTDINFSEIIIEHIAETVFNSEKTDDIELKNSILRLITEIDGGLVSIKSVEKKADKGYVLMSERLYDGTIKEVPFSIESDGTKRLLSLSHSVFLALKHGICCFIDESDLRLHPLLLRKIVHMFKNKDINKNGAQLVFSAHNIINLDSSDLRRDEVWFVEKHNHKSTIFSLYDYEDEDGGDIRSDLNYGKHYLSGRFGAIPFQDKVGDE